MSLTTEERTELLGLLHHLGPDADVGPVLRFAEAHRRGCLDELALVPGFDQIRAAVLRVLPWLLPEAEDRRPLLEGALEAVRTPPGGDLETLRRHPAWIGLAALEIEEQGLDVDALALATAAFRGMPGPKVPSGAGEVLWAMAEQADEVGWSDRASVLLDRARDAEFESEEHRWEVRLLWALDRLERGSPDGAAAQLDEVRLSDEASERSRVHARWVLAAMARAAGRDGDAAALLREALEDIDAESEPDVAARIRETLAEVEG